MCLPEITEQAIDSSLKHVAGDCSTLYLENHSSIHTHTNIHTLQTTIWNMIKNI